MKEQDGAYGRTILAPAAIAKYDGRYIVRGGACELPEGEWKPERATIVEFDSMENAKAFCASPEYKATIQASCKDPSSAGHPLDCRALEKFLQGNSAGAHYQTGLRVEAARKALKTWQ